MTHTRLLRTVNAEVEGASHGNLNICHGAGLVYTGTQSLTLSQHT